MQRLEKYALRKNKRIGHLIRFLLAVALSACAVGPDFHPSPSPTVMRYSNEHLSDNSATAAEQPKPIPSDTIPAQWWHLFASKALDQLVRQGLAHSPTLTAAQARLEATRETLNANTGALYSPALDGSLNSNRRKVIGATFGRSGGSSIYTVHTAAVSVSYALDLFGGGRRWLEYGQAQVDYDALELQAARVTLSANIVTTAIAAASLRAQIKALQQIIAAEAEQLTVTEKQFEIGVIAKADLLSQRAALAQTRTRMPALQKTLAQTRHRLATLIGVLPGAVKLPEFHLDAMTLPHALPLTLPSALTRQRPDVQAADALLHEASAQVGVATANLYPQLNLSASYGSSAIRLADLFSAGSTVWGVGAGLVQPLFHGGELRAKRRAAVARYQEAAAQYRTSVLTAFREVADALLALEMDGENLALQQRAEQLTAQTLDLVHQQHRQGAVSLLTLLDAQRQYQQTRIGLIQARAALYSDSAALMVALGGGWWNQTTPDAANANAIHHQMVTTQHPTRK
ncbi:MAG: efflux transporter outer membrane subunit [Mariprofundales bacterium]|nr:efflux transporter outer membrane subunit [Mariprofundales bacterium]